MPKKKHQTKKTPVFFGFSFQQLSAKVIVTVRASNICTKVLWSEPQTMT